MKVYFVSAPERIKIGFTAKPEKRLRQLQSSDMERLSMIAVINGTRKLEQHLHRLAAFYRLRGEWYRDCLEIRAIIDAAVAGKIVTPNEAETESVPAIVSFALDLTRLPVLDARLQSTRAQRVFLEQSFETIKHRQATGESYDDILQLVAQVMDGQATALVERSRS